MTHTLTISRNLIEAEQFVAWLKAKGHTVSLTNDSEGTVDGVCTMGDPESNETMNRLWSAYCDDDPAIFQGRLIDMAAARELMDDDLCEAIHGTVDNEQEFLDAYLNAHEDKYGVAFAFG